MASQKHLKLIKQGVSTWNNWRNHEQNRNEIPNFRDADLSNLDLTRAELYCANLEDANLSNTSLFDADLRNANLSGANLKLSRIIHTSLQGAKLYGCKVYGVSAWSLITDENTIQEDLIITQGGESSITVDNIEVAQFIYLLIKNKKIRQVIDTITSKVVLILGRFTPVRKTILDAIREELRKYDYIPVLFDFDKPSSRDTHETVLTLASLARFVIADITSPKSIPQELVSIVPNFPSLVVQPILQYGYKPWGMYDHIKRYQSVLDTCNYKDWNELSGLLNNQLIPNIERNAKELRNS